MITNLRPEDEFNFLKGITLAIAPLTALTPLAIVVANIAISIFLDPKNNLTLINTLAIVGFTYITYESLVFCRLIMMKAFSILFGPNQYTHLSFHGYKFDWLQPSVQHPDPIITTHVGSNGNVILNYYYPPSPTDKALHDQLINQGHMFED